MANAARRRQISEAALALFAERGYHATGMGDIARAIGMGTSSLYNHYPSKQAVLSDLAISSMEDLLRLNAHAVAKEVTASAKLGACMRTHVRYHASYGTRARVINAELASLDPEPRAVMIQLRRDYVSRWEHILIDGTTTGEFTPTDSRLTAIALIDLGIGIAAWYQPEGQYSPEELAELYTGYALNMVGAHTEH